MREIAGAVSSLGGESGEGPHHLSPGQALRQPFAGSVAFPGLPVAGMIRNRTHSPMRPTAGGHPEQRPA